VGCARVSSVDRGEGSADEQIVEAVTVDISSRRNGEAAVVVRSLADNTKAVAAVEGRKQKRGTEARRFTEDHIRGACKRTANRRAVGTDDQVGEAIAVDVTGRRDGEAAVVMGGFAHDLESIAAIERGKLEIGRKSRGLAEDHVGRAGIGSTRGSAIGADDQIAETVAIDVARKRDGKAAQVLGRFAVDLKT